MNGPSRRLVIGSSLALAACQKAAAGLAQAAAPAPLKDAAPFAIGTAVQAVQLADPSLSRLIASQFSQVTPEWEMKMEYILLPNGNLRFEAPDAIAAFARRNAIALFGHTLVWYTQKPAAFVDLDPGRASFRQAYVNYIAAVAGRYRDQAVGWDVVNEAVAEDGHGWRECLWSDRLGAFEYMRLAFEAAHAADPAAILFLNDYNLESLPAKRTTFMKLAEQLLAAGAPLGGLGSQTHVDVDLPPGAIATCIAELASLGLPVRISELDVGSSGAVSGLFGGEDARQGALFAEAAEAMMALPPARRFGITVWGVRDRDSSKRRDQPFARPLLFDDEGRAKPAFFAFEKALRG